MAKMAKSAYPRGHTAQDFSCFGPPATKNGQFDGVYLVDMGCFMQDDVDSNKYYNAAVAQSKLDGSWWTYYEWGRIGAEHPQFQFESHPDKESAQRAMAKQVHSKNDKRGIMKKVGGIEMLVAKPGKDVYKVQTLQSRSWGLPDARNITSGEAPPKKAVSKPSSSTAKVDPQTLKLLQDFRIGTIHYARSSMVGGTIPSQSAIDGGRGILAAATARLIKIGNDATKQVKDKILRELTSDLYSQLPKIKPPGVPPEKWILSQDNIFAWNNDLDAFENAIHANDQAVEDSNPLAGMPFSLEWLAPDSVTGKFIYQWMPTAGSRSNRYGNLKIHNVWKVDRTGDEQTQIALQLQCAVEGSFERPLYQPTSRPDLSATEQARCIKSNTSFLFHGTRSVNVPGILRESLRMPKTLVGVAISGAMFGPGLYAADDWQKSAGYTSLSGSYWASGDGEVKGRHAFMFIKEAVLGRPHLAKEAFGYTKAPAGCHSVFGKGGYTKSWGGSLANNEWIVYDPRQVRLRYLVEFSTGSSRY